MAPDSALGLFARLSRAQFTPIMLAPVFLGAALAWHVAGTFSPLVFLVALAGSLLLHLAANTVDDVYDFVNGPDKVSERLFPLDAPGWKPIARGMVSVSRGLAVSYALYGLSLLCGLYLSLVVGWYALAIAAPGILLSYFYTAPPLKLDYRGLGLGELSILLSFGPIPVLGVFYVLSGQLSLLPVIIAIPSGLLTTGVLLSHDLIFYDAYKQAGKRSLAVVLGRKRAALLLSSISAIAYALLLLMMGLGAIPLTGLIALLALPLFPRFADFRGTERPPPEYGGRTKLAFLHSTLFTALVGLGYLLA